jgi:cellulose synthase/poly-beta-1,6-N-acetylglucosamine synthase-like glycosyltransferase
VIYDAEDIPDSDQLKTAVVAFRKNPSDYVCFQAALNYFNAEENVLTRMFTLEYSYWFDYLIPGLDRLKLPIPLGGTSNHFDVAKLRVLGGWDPFNTTEDADLGIRATAEKFRVGFINSTTFEEANANLGNWIRQRSRWVKGYMQTFLVYWRHPLALIRAIGLRQFVAFNLFVGGTPLTFLAAPPLWALFVYWLVTRSHAIEPLFPDTVLYLALANLLLGNFLGIYLNMIAIYLRKNYQLMPYALLNPFYWILHSIASYKALGQLVTKPFYWEKTQHGISRVRAHAVPDRKPLPQ